MQTLAAQISEDTGIPLTENVPPVQWAEESDAIHAYFLHDDQLHAQASFLTLDIGGNSANLGLCSGTEGEHTARFTVPHGHAYPAGWTADAPGTPDGGL